MAAGDEVAGSFMFVEGTANADNERLYNRRRADTVGTNDHLLSSQVLDNCCR